MIIDTSALLTILQDEPERRKFNEIIAAKEERSISVASFAEISIVVEARFASEGIRPSTSYNLKLYLSENFTIGLPY